MNEKFILFFQKIPKINSGKILQLNEYFKGLENAFCASNIELEEFGFKKDEIDLIKKEKEKYSFEKELEKYNRNGIKFFTYFDEKYPKNLKKINLPPMIIFYKGSLENIKESIGVVGTRKPTDYGICVTKDFVEFFAKNKITIISGGALGIDCISHKIALENKTKTIAVMGCSLEYCYPLQNKKIFEQILEQDGAIVSEYQLGMKPIGKNFVVRNRIISGLSDSLLVIEAGIKSGTMTTVEFANEQNKDIYVVPGSIYNQYSQGTNKLIKDGAIFVTNPNEICEMVWGNKQEKIFENNFHKYYQEEKDITWMNEVQKSIYNAISLKAKCIEEIFEEIKIDMSIISSTLILFEIKGLIKNVGGMRYVKI